MPYVCVCVCVYIYIYLQIGTYKKFNEKNYGKRIVNTKRDQNFVAVWAYLLFIKLFFLQISIFPYQDFLSCSLRRNTELNFVLFCWTILSEASGSALPSTTGTGTRSSWTLEMCLLQIVMHCVKHTLDTLHTVIYTRFRSLSTLSKRIKYVLIFLCVLSHSVVFVSLLPHAL